MPRRISRVYKTVGSDGDVVAWIIPHFLRNHLWENADVLVILHGSANIEVFCVNAEEAGTYVGILDGDIYVELDIEHAHDGRAGIDGVV